MKQDMLCLHTDCDLRTSSAGWTGLVSGWGRSRTWVLCFKGNSTATVPGPNTRPPERVSKEAEPAPDLINESLFTSSPGHSQVRPLGWEDPPGEGKGYPLQYSGLDCTVHWGRKESDTTERLSHRSLYTFLSPSRRQQPDAEKP